MLQDHTVTTKLISKQCLAADSQRCAMTEGSKPTANNFTGVFLYFTKSTDKMLCK